MPNFVTNIIAITGPSEQREKLLEQIAFDGKPGTFDFNKVIPMPEGLDIPEGSITSDAIDAYLSVMNPDNRCKLAAMPLDSDEFNTILREARSIRRIHLPKHTLSDDLIAELAERNRVEPEALVELGSRYLDNFRNHGACTWHGWATQQWGTKWNLDPEIPVLDETTGSLRFETAWSMPEPIIEELSRQNPGLTFEISWADEDIGYNVGMRKYQDGCVVWENSPQEGSIAAETMAQEITGYSAVATREPTNLNELIELARSHSDKKQSREQEKPSLSKRKDPER